MKALQWKQEFMIGIETIDAQHRAIFEQLLALENAVLKRDPWHILQYFCSQLTGSFKFHLAVEDALLEIVAYPELEKHRQGHGRLTQALVELEEKLKDSAHTDPLLDYFEAWFIRHVLEEDMEYAKFVRQRLGSIQPAPA